MIQNLKWDIINVKFTKETIKNSLFFCVFKSFIHIYENNVNLVKKTLKDSVFLWYNNIELNIYI